MRYADVEQWSGAALLMLWLLGAGLSLARRVPRVGRLSRRVLTGSGITVALFALQATVVDAVADPDGIAGGDRPVLDWFVAHRSAPATAFSLLVSTIGGTAGMAVLAAAVVLVLWLRHRRWEAGVVAVAAAGAGVLVETLKNLYDRARPPEATRLVVETNNSLPSGHALGSTVVLGIIAAVAVVTLRGAAARVSATALAAAGVLAIGVSRLYLGVHWLTDVIDGWLVGGAWLAVCVVLLSHRPPTPALTTDVPVDQPDGALDGNTVTGRRPGDQPSPSEVPGTAATGSATTSRSPPRCERRARVAPRVRDDHNAVVHGRDGADGTPPSGGRCRAPRSRSSTSGGPGAPAAAAADSPDPDPDPR